MMKFDEVINKLRTGLSALPGHEAHVLMAPGKRLSTLEYLQQSPSYKASSVMVLLFPVEETVKLLLMERSDSLNLHSGQISFPGGRREMDDATPLDTALRETYEEVGIPPSEISMIGQMSDLYIPVSNYLVHPFVGYAEKLPSITINRHEVKQVLCPDLNFFMNEPFPYAEFKSHSGGIINAPYYPFGTHRIWGATAMVISELIYILKK